MEKKYTDQDMMDEIERLRNIMKFDLDSWIAYHKWYKEIEENLKRFVEIKQKHFEEADQTLIKRSNYYYLQSTWWKLPIFNSDKTKQWTN